MNLKEGFIYGLRDFFLSRDFSYDDKTFHFSKTPRLNVVDTISLDFSSYLPRYTVTINMLVRSAEIAKIVASFDSSRFKGQHYFTVRSNQHSVSELYKRDEYKVLSYILDDEQTLERALVNFKSFMNDAGFSFFDRFKNIADFDAWFNGDVLAGSYDFKLGNSGGNAKEGLIAAKLNSNPRYEELYNLWTDGLRREGKYNKTIETLKLLKNYLDTIKA